MILLIGCGNSLRRDDGAGPLLARRLGGRCRRRDLELIACHQLTPELAPLLADPRIKAAIFADAALPGRGAETTGPLLRPIAEEPVPTLLGHRLSPASLLALAARLYGRRPPAWLVTIPGEDFGFGNGLSDAAEGMLIRAEEEVRRLLGKLRR